MVLSAIYYPYPTFKSVEEMKKAILFFEHIYFIVPAQYNYGRLGIERATNNFQEMHYYLKDGIESTSGILSNKTK